MRPGHLSPCLLAPGRPARCQLARCLPAAGQPDSQPSLADSLLDPRDDLIEHLAERGGRLVAEHPAGLRDVRNPSLHVVLVGFVGHEAVGTSGPLILRQISPASSSTVVDSAVDKLKSSLTVPGCSSVSAMPRARSPP